MLDKPAAPETFRTPDYAPDRWRNIARTYTPAEVRRLAGSLPIRHTLPETGARRLWRAKHASASPRRQLAALEVRVLAVDGAGSPDYLDHFGSQAAGDVVRGLLRRQVPSLRDLHLHQFVGAQHVVKGLQHGRRQALVTDVHQHVEMMRFSAQGRALLSGHCHA